LFRLFLWGSPIIFLIYFMSSYWFWFLLIFFRLILRVFGKTMFRLVFFVKCCFYFIFAQVILMILFFIFVNFFSAIRAVKNCGFVHMIKIHLHNNKKIRVNYIKKLINISLKLISKVYGHLINHFYDIFTKTFKNLGFNCFENL
jgi:membrane protein implicated in regulation of membrane protease activity